MNKILFAVALTACFVVSSQAQAQLFGCCQGGNSCSPAPASPCCGGGGGLLGGGMFDGCLLYTSDAADE